MPTPAGPIENNILMNTGEEGTGSQSSSTTTAAAKAATRQRSRFTVMEAVVRDFISLSANDRAWVRQEIAAKEAEESASAASAVTPVAQG